MGTDDCGGGVMSCSSWETHMLKIKHLSVAPRSVRSVREFRSKLVLGNLLSLSIFTHVK